MDRKRFFDTLRPHINLTTQNVIGIEKVVAYGEKRGSRRDDLAYILATAWWETAQTMHPVVEAYWLSEAWRKKNLRYYPWHGRGLIQTTWKENYKKMGDVIGVDLLKNPDLLLNWAYALPALFIGMERGLYTGHSLSDHIDNIEESDKEDTREYIAARRIVNGIDKAQEISSLAMAFRAALRSSGYDPSIPVRPPPDVEPSPVAPAPEEKGLWATFIDFLKMIFRKG